MTPEPIPRDVLRALADGKPVPRMDRPLYTRLVEMALAAEDLAEAIEADLRYSFGDMPIEVETKLAAYRRAARGEGTE